MRREGIYYVLHVSSARDKPPLSPYDPLLRPWFAAELFCVLEIEGLIGYVRFSGNCGSDGKHADRMKSGEIRKF